MFVSPECWTVALTLHEGWGQISSSCLPFPNAKGAVDRACTREETALTLRPGQDRRLNGCRVLDDQVGLSPDYNHPKVEEVRLQAHAGEEGRDSEFCLHGAGSGTMDVIQ